jgi:aspartyl-tRNA(Asn)/glutamyl-tRNA(Gln) amidotransferase subunit B
MAYDKYETVIGLEIHVQLNMNSKAFCADATKFGAAPNTQISPISLGHPGTLPRLNEKQLDAAVYLGLALGSTITPYTTFDRKNYFYADLPKGYQITQDNAPVCVGGQLEIEVGGQKKHIRIHHIHMEEDAGKSIHEKALSYSQIDLNRAGVPLLEVVSEPDLRSAEEVDAYMSAMRQLVRYLGISDGNMEEGSMRCDCNVSVRLRGATRLGERCEIKNLNSMRYAKRAIAYEVKRQIDLIEAGGKVQQQTLNFDPETGVTSPLRDKEDAHDYRYFPEPDLPPVVLSDQYIEAIRQKMPDLPWALKERLLTVYHLPDYDASLLTEEKATASYFMTLAALSKNYKAIANLIINKVLPYCIDQDLALSQFPVAPEQLVSFIQLIEDGQVSNSMAYQRVFPALIEAPQEAPLAIAKRLNVVQDSDSDTLEALVEEVLSKHPDAVMRYQKGKRGLLGFFMGEVMKASRGKADPKVSNALLRKKLDV